MKKGIIIVILVIALGIVGYFSWKVLTPSEGPVVIEEEKVTEPEVKETTERTEEVTEEETYVEETEVKETPKKPEKVEETTAEDFTYLTELNHQVMTPNKRAWFGETSDGTTFLFPGSEYQHGIAMVIGCKVKYNLPDNYSTFSAVVGVGRAHVDYKDKLVFKLYGDGELLYKSDPLPYGEIDKIKEDIKGYNSLTLTVNAVEQVFTDYALWAEPKLVK